MAFLWYVFIMFKDIYSVSYKMKKELYAKIWTVIAVVLACIGFVSLVMNFLIYPAVSRSDSMEPCLSEQSTVLVSPLVKTPNRGDVMLVQYTPKEKRPFFVSSLDFIFRLFTAQRFSPFKAENSMDRAFRRVVALPGDTVYINNYVVFVKPQGQSHFLTEFELTKTKYNLSLPLVPDYVDTTIGSMGQTEEFTLGANEYYLLGDNRLECTDSRLWGPVQKSSMVGKALLVYFPFSKIRLF